MYRADAGGHQVIRETLNLIPTAAVDEIDFDDAASIYRLARGHGHTVRSSLDCLIAALALRLDLVVVHRDVDFARMSAVVPALSAVDPNGVTRGVAGSASAPPDPGPATRPATPG